ncbi:Clp protease N-terminal domain-containing protein [Bacillus licheniformis]|nr:Clp protease N-terminal domain-containing protein [Bacillus licheniformis]
MKRYDVWKIHRKSTKVLALAQEEALRLGHNNIGTEHILLGLVREGEGIAAKALQALGLSPDKIQKKLKPHRPRTRNVTIDPLHTESQESDRIGDG